MPCSHSPCVVAVFALAIPATRRFLFGTSDGTEEGWVTEHLVPWMRDRWWALLLILVIIIVVPAVASYVRQAASRRSGGEDAIDCQGPAGNRPPEQGCLDEARLLSSTMRAVVCHEFGPPERLVVEDVEDPATAGRAAPRRSGGVGGDVSRHVDDREQVPVQGDPAVHPWWRGRRCRHRHSGTV